MKRSALRTASSVSAASAIGRQPGRMFPGRRLTSSAVLFVKLASLLAIFNMRSLSSSSKMENCSPRVNHGAMPTVAAAASFAASDWRCFIFVSSAACSAEESSRSETCPAVAATRSLT